jgi:hypothetical protein
MQLIYILLYEYVFGTSMYFMVRVSIGLWQDFCNFHASFKKNNKNLYI